MTDRALDALDDVLQHGTHEAKVRAAKLVLDRTAPAAGPHSVAAVFVPVPDTMVGGTSPTERIRARLAELAQAAVVEPAAPLTLAELAARQHQGAEVVDAELVEPDPVEHHPGYVRSEAI